jgi:hypothetical protein
MKMQQFYENLAGYDFDTVYKLSTPGTVTGDWLPWFTLDLATHIASECETGTITVDLTACYPGSGDGCNLLLKGPADGELTYIELANQYGTVTQALEAFKQAIIKQYRHPDVEAFCLLSSIGSWLDDDFTALDALVKSGGVSDYYLLGTDNNGNDFIKSSKDIKKTDYQLKGYYYLVGVSVSQVKA